MRLRFKRRRFGQIAIASSMGAIPESLIRKTQALPLPQSNTPSAISPDPSSFVDIKLRIAEVRVEPDLGEVRVTRWVGTFGVGRLLKSNDGVIDADNKIERK